MRFAVAWPRVVGLKLAACESYLMGSFAVDESVDDFAGFGAIRAPFHLPKRLKK